MRIYGRKPECWNPLTGEIDFRPSYEQKNNRTEVTLTLAPNESVFIVYPTEKNCFGDEKSLQKQQKEGSYSAKEFSEVAVELGEYTVNFITNGRTVNRKELFDWSREQDEKIRYYSEQPSTGLHSIGKANRKQLFI